MDMKLVLILFLLITSIIPSAAQNYVYEAFINEQKVGEMKVVREVNDESEKISILTQINTHPLAGLQLYFKSNSSYMDGKLMDATSLTKMNGEASNSQTTFRNGGYTISVDGKVKLLDELVLFGNDLLYFEEPRGLERVYVLALGKELTLHKEGNHSWYFEYKGKKEVYTYTAGVLVELQVDHSSYSLAFRLKQ